MMNGEEVWGGDDASRDDEGPFSRLELMWGKAGLARLAASHVLVCGVGGVGGSCVIALARGGVGRIFVVDADVVQPSNLNRQAVAFRSTMGRRKVEVARDMIADINPDCQVSIRAQLITPDNADALLEDLSQEAAGGIDYVVDAIDTVSAKIALAAAVQKREIRLVSSMGAAWRTHPEHLRFADIYETQVCPLCRAVRKLARAHGIKQLEVLYSDEVPLRSVQHEGPEHGSVKAALGTASFMPPVMGEMLAGRVICALVGQDGTGAARSREDTGA